jgi:alpha-L-rhamnosidase
MTSFTHYALGAVADWLHRVGGGLAVADPGYSRLRVAPRPGGGILSSETSLRTPYGRAAVSWALNEGILEAHVEVPAGTEAVIDLPGQAEFTVGSGAHRYSTEVAAQSRPADPRLASI